jgi:RNA 3'-terminal phosphate cyclase (ATP)
MLVIDGSRGEGGGQVLRTSLALSLVTGQPFRIKKIRAGRQKPGLLRQHLTAVNAAAEIGRAQVVGNTLGSREITFQPGPVRAGRYHFAIGTAGSCTLVLQTILPALLTGKEPSELLLEGGTHNTCAPPFDFISSAFLPLLRRMGAKVLATLERPGFHPAGGGRIRVRIEPASHLSRLDLAQRGALLDWRARALVALLPRHVGERELRMVQEALGWKEGRLQVQEIATSAGPGNVLILEVVSAALTEVFTGFGERGVRAEQVAMRAIREAAEYLAAVVPVGRHLADQLLLPMALAGGGSFRTLSPTRHATTNIEVIQRFLPIAITVKQFTEQCWEFRIGP